MRLACGSLRPSRARVTFTVSQSDGFSNVQMVALSAVTPGTPWQSAACSNAEKSRISASGSLAFLHLSTWSKNSLGYRCACMPSHCGHPETIALQPSAAHRNLSIKSPFLERLVSMNSPSGS